MGSERKNGRGKLVKITTYLTEDDVSAIKEFVKDGTKESEHYRAAVRDYVQKQKRKRRGM